jgi:hypothetical protein
LYEIFGGESMLKKKYSSLIAVMSVCFIIAFSVPMVAAVVVENDGNGPPSHLNDGTVGMIQVTSDGTIWYTIVPYAGGNLVYNGHNGGSFQPLDPTTTPASTPYGPGDVGYRGGRWWIDNGPDDHTDNGIMDPDDTYFLCPLTLKAPGT